MTSLEKKLLGGLLSALAILAGAGICAGRVDITLGSIGATFLQQPLSRCRSSARGVPANDNSWNAIVRFAVSMIAR